MVYVTIDIFVCFQCREPTVGRARSAPLGSLEKPDLRYGINE